MRLRLNAAENNQQGFYDRASTRASMRPRLNAAENLTRVSGLLTDLPCFNEAAAKRRGKPPCARKMRAWTLKLQ